MKKALILNTVYVTLIIFLFISFRLYSSDYVCEYPDYIMNLGIYLYGFTLILNIIFEIKKIRRRFFSILFLMSYLLNSYFWVWKMIISKSYDEIIFVLIMYIILAPPILLYFYRQRNSINKLIINR